MIESEHCSVQDFQKRKRNVNKNMFVIKNTKIFLAIASVIILLAVSSIFGFGLNIGIDFKGGTIIEVSYPEEYPTQQQVETVVGEVANGGFSVRPVGESGYSIRTPFLEDIEREMLIEGLTFSEENTPRQDRVSSIGPVIGDELTSKALWAMGIVILVIIVFIAFSFRKVSGDIEPEGDKKKNHTRGLSSWYYGLSAIIALMFDTIVPTGAFALFGTFVPAEIDILFVTALLAILGYSINDTIIVFDRIRENLVENHSKKKKEEFADTVGRSLGETYTRSTNTSLTTFFVLLMLYIFGGSSTQFFAFTLLVGVVAGTYSSIFIASPLLVVFNSWKEKKEKVKNL